MKLPTAYVRQTNALRLSLTRALRSETRPLEAARAAADALLLAALASEQLGGGGTQRALDEGILQRFQALASLVASVEKETGLALHLDLPDTTRAPLGQAEFPAGTFTPLKQTPDPFGVLGQLLRDTVIEDRDGSLVPVPSNARRDDGGYYTAYRLARRLVESTIPDGDDVPSLIDPACGAGTFLSAAFDVLFERLEQRRRRDPMVAVEPVSWSIVALHGVDIDPTALLAARLSLAVRAVKADRALGRRGQLALFGQSQTYGPLVTARLRLGDALGEAPADLTPGTQRLKLRLYARDEPSRLPEATTLAPIRWDRDFPLRFSDAEGAFPRDAGFDVVVTNPPFVPVDRIPVATRTLLKDALATSQRRFDLFIGFVERALTLLRPGGRATLLIPRTFLSEANAEKARRMLLESARLERIDELGTLPFGKVRIECIAITFVATRPTDTTSVRVMREGEPGVDILQDTFKRLPKAMFRLEVAHPSADLHRRLAEQSIPLGRLFCASWGARGSPVSEFHLTSPSHPLARPMLKGEDINPFRITPQPRWLLYDKDRLYRPSREEFFENPKVLVRKVTGAAGIVAAVDESLAYADDSLACIVPKAAFTHVGIKDRRRHRLTIAPHQLEPSRRYPLHLVAALIQTPLVQEHYRLHLGGGLNVYPELIELLPLPAIEKLGSPEALELEALAKAAAAGAPFPFRAADALARRLYAVDDA